MVTCKVSDYLTISVLPAKSDVSIDSLLRQALKCLFLDELWDKSLFEFKCSTQYFECVYRYADIQVKIAYEDNFERNGICFEFSGKGMDYYREYISTHYNKVDLRFALSRFVALADLGYKTTCSRFDVAFDEIIKEGEQLEQLLDLERVQDCLKKGAFVSTFRKSDATSSSGEVKSVFTLSPDKIDAALAYRVLESIDLSTGKTGKTIELGRRKSSSFIRFYDKLVEQSVHKEDISGIAAWNRCEIEFKHANACSVLLTYAMSKDDKDFSDKIRGKIFTLLRFVDLDRSRKYNCTVCQWWVDFLNKVKPYKFTYNVPNRNKFIRSLDHQKKRNAASLAALLSCAKGNFRSILVEGFNNPTKTTLAIMQDYEAVKQLDKEAFDEYYADQTEKLTGLDFWRQFCPGYSDEQFEKYFTSFVNHLIEDCCKVISEVCRCGV